VTRHDPVPLDADVALVEGMLRSASLPVDQRDVAHLALRLPGLRAALDTLYAAPFDAPELAPLRTVIDAGGRP
jgi:hypothetical protein